MNILLDTHAFIWVGMDSPRLSAAARQVIAENANQAALSIASLWEIAIKSSKGALLLDRPFEQFIERVLARWQLNVLPIELPHLQSLIALPNHHRDPFDRLLAAQAICEGLTLVRNDQVFDSYGVGRIW